MRWYDACFVPFLMKREGWTTCGISFTYFTYSFERKKEKKKTLTIDIGTRIYELLCQLDFLEPLNRLYRS